MALKDQPYLPLYVQDFLTDEKLNMCSPSAQGVYIKIMCVLHKSDTYGKLLLNQKFKQISSKVKAFASQFACLLPFTEDVVFASVEELVSEGVLKIDGDFIYQKRMVTDNDISVKRSLSGKKGGNMSVLSKNKPKKFAQAKIKQNAEYEYENNTVLDNNTLTIIQEVPNSEKPEEKKWNTMPTEKDVGELNETQIGSVIEYVKITKKVDISVQDVAGLWSIHKKKALTGKKYYDSEHGVYTHFLQSLKFEKIEENKLQIGKDGINKRNLGAYQLLEKGKQTFDAIRAKRSGG